MTRDRGDYFRERRRQQAEAEGRRYIERSPAGTRVKQPPRWVPGSPITVEEFEEL